ncbi:MAG: protein kinase [Pseudomonadota bacterium]
MSDEAPLAHAATAGAATLPGVGNDLPAGTVVGEYRIERIVGRGGMGVVYAAIHPVIEKKVAVKVLAAQFSSTPDLVRRFVDEARAVNRIGHENIIDIFSFGQLADGRQYFVMEYLEGATLATRLERNDLSASDGPTLLAQICDALEAAHAKKIVHRDLKPENVWIGTSNRGLRVRLLDFGIAKLLDIGDQMVTDIGAVMGTPHFMSPEQCNGRGVDHRTDIYAMGVIMYRMFAGRLPINGETFAEILAKQLTETPPPPSTFAAVPKALDHLIVRCLAKEPADRPQTAAELAAALSVIFPFPAGGILGPASGPVVSGQGTTNPALELSPTQLPAQHLSGAMRTAPSPRRRTLAFALVLAGILAIAGLVGGMLIRQPANAPDTRAGAVRPPPELPSDASSAGAPPPRPQAAGSTTAPPPESSSQLLPANAGNPIHPAAAGKRRPGAEPATTPKNTDPKAGSSRASRTGLVTDNPFE